MECNLTAKDGASIGTYDKVSKAIIKDFPDSKLEEPNVVVIFKDGEHIADVFLQSDSEEDEVSADDNIEWFNIIGDDDGTIFQYLKRSYPVELMDM